MEPFAPSGPDRAAAGSTSWNRAHAAEKPDRPSSLGPAAALPASTGPLIVYSGGLAAGSPEPYSPEEPYSPDLGVTPPCAAQAAANRPYNARAAGSRAVGWKPPVGRSEAKMPTASGPRSPAKSGSHSAIVDPIRAATRRFAASMAWRNATPSGMCEARMRTSGRAALSWVMTPGKSGTVRSYVVRETTGVPSVPAVAAAASATDFA